MTKQVHDPDKDTNRFYPPSNGLLAHMVRDGIIMGALTTVKRTCGNCHRACLCVEVTDVNLPRGIERKDTIAGSHRFIGVGCGCYGKFHRQVAHISDRMKTRERS